MDLRKQKRLGPAPIASFEKSFEDSTSTIATTTTTASTTATATATATQAGNKVAQSSTLAADALNAKDINRNGEAMESSECYTKATAKTAIATATTTTSIQQQLIQQQQQPSISVSATESTANIKASTKSNCDGNYKRPPPLKATTAGAATTTLVSSGSGEQQLQQQVGAYRSATTLTTPSTPRIELSRASSSSHHEEDSRDSSPENVFEQVGTGTLQESIGLGFREEGALELRSSTEELYFMDPEQKKEEQEKMQQQQAKRSSPHIFKFDEHQSYLQQHQRKDSASSEVAALLCISGRTSRISSVGSQGSAVSRLSAISGISRSPSPHRMLLETSFCGPKPLENVVDGRVSTTIEPPTAELLEQVLLSRKHDPTQAVLAEGIKVEGSPKKKPTSLSNGDAKVPAATAKGTTQTARVGAGAGATAKAAAMGAQRRSNKSPGQMVVGKTPGGTEYIRINLKPDYMYDDKGIAPHERVVEAPNSLAPVYARSQKKPASLSLGRSAMDETRLTPTASPKPTRHSVLSKDSHGSRSPSPATVSVSRKSSFSSLFRVGGKDSPDSPRERSRSRSKSKERQTSQSQNVTPSKQKSVLAIFKPGKRGSNAGNDAKSSKSSSPIDGHEPMQPGRGKSHTPIMTATGSRPASRLRYYDEPVEGVIHIPLHTPPEEKETSKLLQGIQQLNAEPTRSVSAPITASQLAAAAAALRPVGARKDSGAGLVKGGQPRPQQIEKVQHIENLDAIHSLPQDDDNKERNWSTEVNRHSSQDSQETVGSESSFASAIKISLRSNLAGVKENVVQENGVAAEAEIHRLPSVESTMSACEAKIVETVATVNVNITQQQESELVKEKRRLLFATRLGSGSQEQIFSTQFSISKTESQSSQLSEQMQETIAESPASECLHRQGTVIRRSEEDTDGGAASATSAPAAVAVATPVATATRSKGPPKRHSSIEAGTRRPKSVSTSEDEKPGVQTTVAAVVMRRKELHEETRRKSRSTSEDDADAAIVSSVANQRHSRYLENFDVRKKYHENVPRKPKRQSISENKRTDAREEPAELPVAAVARQEKHQQPPPPPPAPAPAPALPKQQPKQHQSQPQQRKPTLPQPPPPSTAPSPSPPPATQSATGSRSPTPTKPMPRSQSQSPVERSRQTPTKPPRTATPPRRPQATTERQSVHSTDEPVESSESERDRDSDLANGGGGGSSAATDPKRRHLARHVGVIEDHESTGLVSQESFDELPYVPTTLPEERAQGVSLIPMKERANMELKTCPVDRPRSTTPLNPSHLEEYYGIVTPQEPTCELSGSAPVRGEKLRISLPRKDSQREKTQTSKSPRRTSNASGKSWFEFAEEGLRAVGNLERKDSSKQLLQQQQPQHQQPEEPKAKVSGKAITTTVQTTQITPTSGATSTQRKLSGHWIDFENIPEKRKPPKRITALPKDGVAGATTGSRGQHGTGTGTHHHGHHGHHHPQPDVTASTENSSSDGKLHYNYVKPEDCQCECHEVHREAGAATSVAPSTTGVAGSAGTATGAGNKAITSVDLLQQGEDMLPLLDPDTQDGIEPSDSSREYSCYTDDEMDVPMRQSGSSRSKSSSSKMDEFPRRDVSHSPRNRKFPDNRK